MDPVEPWIDADAVRRMAAQLLSRSDTPELGERPDAGFGPGFEGFVGSSAPPPAPERIADESARGPSEVTPVEPPERARPEPVPVEEQEQARPEPVPIEEPAVAAEASPHPVGPPPLPPSRLAPEAASPEAPAPARESDRKPEPQRAAAEPEPPPDAPAAASPERRETQEQVAPSKAESPFRRVETESAGRPAAADPGRERLLARLEHFRDSLCRHAQAKGVFILDREGEPILDDPTFGKLHFLARSLAQAYRPVEGQAGNVHVKVGAEAFLVVVPVDTRAGCMVLGTVLRQPLDAAAVEVVSKALVKVVDG